MKFPSQSASATALPVEALHRPAQAIWQRIIAAAKGVLASAKTWLWVLAIGDQAVVSGTRFLTAIILGRFAGPEQLGTYSLALSVLVLIGCLQEALLTTPFAVFGARLGRRSRAAYAGGITILHGALAVGGTLAALMVAGLLLLSEWSAPWVSVALALAISLPCSLLWEFARRFALARLEVTTAFLIDAAVATLQLGSLAALAFSGGLTAHLALTVVGGACLVAGAAWFICSLSTRTMHWRLTWLYWRRNWHFGRWLCAGQLVSVFHGLAPVWIVVALAGAESAGAFVACMNLALLANPVIFAIGNLLTPRASQALAAEGCRGVVRIIWQAEALLAGGLAVFALILLWWGERIVALVYGPSYGGLGIMPGLLGVSAIAWASSAVFSSGLAALKRPAFGFVATLIGSVVSLSTITMLAPQWHALGAIVGLSTGSWLVATLQFLAFFYSIKEHPGSVSNVDG